ncbi:MAG TPA: hypothetical protein VK429_02200 [Patescibacteria group bacterium]|nr:hypothetical protein [Patescibacteria group bacterium]
MLPWNPEVGEILTAIISLACRGGEQFRVPRIYSVLSELKGRDVLLSGLYFSITGAVCYSRQIEETLRSLMAKGVLVPTERDTVIVRDEAAKEIRARLRYTLPSSIFRSLQDTSQRFYRKMFRTR